jgi:hypothetical protein
MADMQEHATLIRPAADSADSRRISSVLPPDPLDGSGTRAPGGVFAAFVFDPLLYYGPSGGRDQPREDSDRGVRVQLVPVDEPRRGLRVGGTVVAR